MIKEEDIRPEKLNKISIILHKQDVRKVLENKNKFVIINCPACLSTKYKKIFIKNKFSFVSCKQCETIFANPRPTVKMLFNYYSKSKLHKFWNDKIYPASEKVRRDNIFVPRARMIASLCKKYKMKTKTLIDVGAGFGTFCEEIRKLKIFKRIILIEPNHDLASICQEKGFIVYEQPIEYVKNLQADVITNFELIEHLFRPEDFIKVCKKYLSSSGFLVLTTPNALGFDISLLGRESDHINGPDHINLFNPKSITTLLKRLGFKVELLLTPGELDAEIVRKKALSGKINISSNKFLSQILIDRWGELGQKFQKFIADNGLSSHMMIVARKIT